MPNVIRFLRGYDTASCSRGLPRRRMWRLLENPSNGRCAEMKTCTTHHLGHLEHAKCRTQCLEPLHSITDEIGKLVDRLADLHEGVGALLIESLRPRRDGDGRRPTLTMVS